MKCKINEARKQVLRLCKSRSARVCVLTWQAASLSACSLLCMDLKNSGGGSSSRHRGSGYCIESNSALYASIRYRLLSEGTSSSCPWRCVALRLPLWWLFACSPIYGSAFIKIKVRLNSGAAS